MRRVFIAFLIFITVFSGCVGESVEGTPKKRFTAKVDTVNTPIREKRVFYRDSLVDFTARYLAGMQQQCKNPFSKLQQEKAWTDHSNDSEKNWKKLNEERIEKMKHWSDSVLRPHFSDSLTLFYPFSGPDFLHAHYLFPRSTRIIMCALEPIIDLPDLLLLNPENRSTYLKSLRNSLRDIYGKSYFITNHMKDDLSRDKVRGVLPLFYVFLVRSGHEILEIDPVGLDSSGKMMDTLIEKRSSKWIGGVRFRYRHFESDTLRELFYFSTDISDKGIKTNPGMIRMVDQMGGVNTFIKSASYLLHYSTFKVMRDCILRNSFAIFQDDTGIPFRYFKSGKDWKWKLFGEYTRPVKDFGDFTIQSDLDSIYSVIKDIPSLPFHLGYHWGDRKQSQQLYLRK